MLKSHTNANGIQTVEDLNHPFVRLPISTITTVFHGWGPRI